jgi:hypothetical protein
VISDRNIHDVVVVGACGPIGHRVRTCGHLLLAEARHVDTLSKKLARISGNTRGTHDGDCLGPSALPARNRGYLDLSSS